MRLLASDGYQYATDDVSDVLGKRSRISQNTRIQKHVANRYVPQFCGHTVCSDVFYPLGEVGREQSKPHVLFSCALSRSLAEKPIRGISPECGSSAFSTFRIMVFGRCRLFLTDKGPGYTGGFMESFFESWSIWHVTVLMSASHSNGLIERHVRLVKEGLKNSRRSDPDSSDGELSDGRSWPGIWRRRYLPE